jgi:predicted acyltransferase
MMCRAYLMLIFKFSTIYNIDAISAMVIVIMLQRLQLGRRPLLASRKVAQLYTKFTTSVAGPGICKLVGLIVPASSREQKPRNL